ncbi:hypothetical protein NSB25_11485 [Acetatifactor muris]|uniref:Uncharacterized protein n=1 Tax=Acetatifactor muris TaxID=879566 RepID=A0A2K4ZGW1_9FIRM|nr:hypothetical protein [Acetatifactor muris]MCR2047907.1 hypothetical protein [Acetatifactor muris]SOY29709.1 hypothetical protein AMURIS_02430 [Acetatifactor muris]
MGLRSLARTVAANKSYRQSGTTDMFDYFFTKAWRENGHPASGADRPTKKRRRGRK